MNRTARPKVPATSQGGSISLGERVHITPQLASVGRRSGGLARIRHDA